MDSGGPIRIQEGQYGFSYSSKVRSIFPSSPMESLDVSRSTSTSSTDSSACVLGGGSPPSCPAEPACQAASSQTSGWPLSAHPAGTWRCRRVSVPIFLRGSFSSLTSLSRMLCGRRPSWLSLSTLSMSRSSSSRPVLPVPGSVLQLPW